MGRATYQDNIPSLVVASTTSVTLAATFQGQPTRISVGGQQYSLTSLLTLSTASTGANGLDTGAQAANKTYYVYAIVHNTTFALAIVASLVGPSTGPTMPSGYGTAYKLIGGFSTDSTPNIISAGPSTVSGTLILPSTVQRFLSGSGTYNTPSGAVRIKVRMCGGGGGGGNGAGAGTAGSNTTFGSSLLTANGGGSGAAGGALAIGGTGGTATVSSPALAIVAVQGGYGNVLSFSGQGTGTTCGGNGGSNPFGGAGSGIYGNSPSTAAVANTGAGGGGGGALGTNNGGTGGGAGGYIEAMINSPLSSYSYSVGGGGAGAGSGSGAGAAGGSGIIIVEEYYS